MSFQIHLNSKHADSYNNNSISDCNYYIPPIDTQMIIKLMFQFKVQIFHIVSII